MNFKGYIGLPLETYANSYFKMKQIPFRITADEIECGAYISTIVTLLLLEYRCDSDIIAFVQRIRKYLGEPANQIDINQAYEIFNEFKNLFNLK